MTLNQLIEKLEELRQKYHGELLVFTERDEVEIVGVFDDDGQDCCDNGGAPAEVYIGS